MHYDSELNDFGLLGQELKIMENSVLYSCFLFKVPEVQVKKKP